MGHNEMPPPADVLLTLQLQVARRADELVRTRAEGAGLNLYCWLLAESEVLSGVLPDRTAETVGPSALRARTPHHAEI